MNTNTGKPAAPSVQPCELARAWLSRVKRQREEVESRTFWLQTVRAAASRITAALGQDPVVHSRNTSAMDDSVARIMEAENALADAFADLIDITEEVSALLGRIHDSDCRRVMELIYISFRKPSDIAEDMKCSRRWISELHQKGLRIVQRRLEDREPS